MKGGGLRPKITVRPMQKADAKRLAAMTKALANDHHERSPVTEKHFLTCLLPHATDHAWIALVDNITVGFATSRDWMNFVRGKKVRTIDQIYVIEKERRKGIGEALIRTIAKDSLKESCTRLDITAAAQNKIANRLYKKMNFKKRPLPSVQYKIEADDLMNLANKT